VDLDCDGIPGTESAECLEGGCTDCGARVGGGAGIASAGAILLGLLLASPLRARRRRAQRSENRPKPGKDR
jgi:hypothetical protein